MQLVIDKKWRVGNMLNKEECKDLDNAIQHCSEVIEEKHYELSEINNE